MTDFPNLELIITAVESAQIAFNIRTNGVVDDAKTVAETAKFNQTLVQALSAIKADLNNAALIGPYLEEWRPKTEIDTWFGPDPATYLRHVLQNRSLHRMGLPDVAELH
jgi:hypothetical protein